MSTNYIDVHASTKEYENLMRIFSVLISYFDSQVSTYGASRQDNSTLLNKLKEQDYLFRIGLLSEYYNITRDEIEMLINLPKSQRAEACSEKGVNRFILRTLFDYNRYSECYLLHHFLSQRFECKNKNLLDFGCLVSDYGFYFGMLNMHVTLCDLEEQVDFASFRLSRANINHVKYHAPADYMELTKDQDIAIFSEVLEHLTDPFLLLESCVRNNVSYIFTSMYPYGDEDYFNLPGHTKEAKEQAPHCIELLRKGYQEITLMKRRTAWVKMNSSSNGLV